MDNNFYEFKKMKNGKYRLYCNIQQALIAWRGLNIKREVVRDQNNNILNFNTIEELQKFCQEKFGQKAFKWSDT
jgi:hypothetical protein